MRLPLSVSLVIFLHLGVRCVVFVVVAVLCVVFCFRFVFGHMHSHSLAQLCDDTV